MLANRITGILPDLTEEAALEIAAIASVTRHGFDAKNWLQIPFRSPHHSASSVALVGGGRPPRPGEVSLAHQGVLFLDELTEFQRPVLESLREPLEAGQITISRASFQEVFPAKFQLVAAMNPCPCGYAGNKEGDCRCTTEQIERYLAKLSGPLLDRIDLHIEVNAPPPEILSIPVENQAESIVVKNRVIIARKKQKLRQGKYNNELSGNELMNHCSISMDLQTMLHQVVHKMHLSARAYHRILKVSRTIADLADSERILKEHLSEALLYRNLDRSKYVLKM
jgi:magnesium chelatase family protein